MMLIRGALIAAGAALLLGAGSASAAAADDHDRPTDRCVLALPQPRAAEAGCRFTATGIDNIYVLGPTSWRVTVRRGSQVYRYGSENLADWCFLSPNGFTGRRLAFCSDRILRGDRVTATLTSDGTLAIGDDPVCESLFWCRNTVYGGQRAG